MNNFNSGNVNCQIIVENLNLRTSANDLYEVFSYFGFIRSLKLAINSDNESLGICTIEYNTESEVTNAINEMDGFRLDGHLIFVERPRYANNYHQSRAKQLLLSHQITEDDFNAPSLIPLFKSAQQYQEMMNPNPLQQNSKFRNPPAPPQYNISQNSAPYNLQTISKDKKKKKKNIYSSSDSDNDRRSKKKYKKSKKRQRHQKRRHSRRSSSSSAYSYSESDSSSKHRHSSKTRDSSTPPSEEIVQSKLPNSSNSNSKQFYPSNDRNFNTNSNFSLQNNDDLTIDYHSDNYPEPEEQNLFQDNDSKQDNTESDSSDSAQTLHSLLAKMDNENPQDNINNQEDNSLNLFSNNSNDNNQSTFYQSLQMFQNILNNNNNSSNNNINQTSNLNTTNFSKTTMLSNNFIDNVTNTNFNTNTNSNFNSNPSINSYDNTNSLFNNKNNYINNQSENDAFLEKRMEILKEYAQKLLDEPDIL